MDYFPIITANWNIIAHRPVTSADGSDKMFSLNGRFICLMHTLATPIKGISGLGKLILSIIRFAERILAVLTLNASPKNLLYSAAALIDIPVGAALLPAALLANFIRGLIGTIFHPGAMIIDDINKREVTPPFELNHNILYGTLVNY